MDGVGGPFSPGSISFPRPPSLVTTGRRRILRVTHHWPWKGRSQLPSNDSRTVGDQTRFAHLGPCGPDGLQGLLAEGGKDVDQSGDRRVGGDRTEDGRLAPQHREIREAVTAEREPQGDVQEDLARIVYGPGFRHGARVQLESAFDGGGNKAPQQSSFFCARPIEPTSRQFFFSSWASITMMPLGPRTYVSL